MCHEYKFHIQGYKKLTWCLRLNEYGAQFCAGSGGGAVMDDCMAFLMALTSYILNLGSIMYLIHTSSIPAHRKALVQLLTSSHTLAVEVLRWSEHCRPPVPRSVFMRFCLSEVEDEAHALWYCEGSRSLEDLRSNFFKSVFLMATTHLRIC